MSNSAMGPSLASVLAFTMVEPLDHVARVYRAAENRLSRHNPWRGYRVFGVDITNEIDGLVRIRVYCDPIAEWRETQVFEFLTGADDTKRSHRLDAFLAAVGIRDKVEDVQEIEGRYFSAQNSGRSPNDFAPLKLAVFGAAA